MEDIAIDCPTDWTDYELIDSGDGMKLERFGPDGPSGYIVARPDPRAIWKKSDEMVWDKADAKFVRTSATDGNWDIKKNPPAPWIIGYHDLKFVLKPTSFKHVGVFPEQATNWQWMENKIQGLSVPFKILNLFAYTGGATMAVARAGAHVTHVDSIKSTITWARENVELSGLKDKPIRWIEDDAYKFVVKEGKREALYDGIIMDPPRFGRGTKGEIWKIEEDLPKLLSAVKSILSAKPTFILLNAYTADLSSLVLHHALKDLTKEYGGTVDFGELTVQESQGKRLLPSGIFARWATT